MSNNKCRNKQLPEQLVEDKDIGRPAKHVTDREVFLLAHCGLSMAHVAAALGVDPMTISRTYGLAYHEGKASRIKKVLDVNFDLAVNKKDIKAITNELKMAGLFNEQPAIQITIGDNYEDTSDEELFNIIEGEKVEEE